MAVAKVTSSKKAVQFITDEGHVFQTSLVFMTQLLAGQVKGDFVLLTRMPFDVSPDRFKKSPVYNKGMVGVDSTKTNSDSFSVKAKEETKQSNIYNTDVIL
jgi:hypothetical protein